MRTYNNFQSLPQIVKKPYRCLLTPHLMTNTAIHGWIARYMVPQSFGFNIRNPSPYYYIRMENNEWVVYFKRPPMFKKTSRPIEYIPFKMVFSQRTLQAANYLQFTHLQSYRNCPNLHFKKDVPDYQRIVDQFSINVKYFNWWPKTPFYFDVLKKCLDGEGMNTLLQYECDWLQFM